MAHNLQGFDVNLILQAVAKRVDSGADVQLEALSSNSEKMRQLSVGMFTAHSHIMLHILKFSVMQVEDSFFSTPAPFLTARSMELSRIYSQVNTTFQLSRGLA